MKNKLFFVSLILIFVSWSLSFGQATPKDTEIPQAGSAFRYVIISCDEDDNESIGNPVRGRSVQILMDEKAFSEPNLRGLFLLLSKRFPRPVRLYVDVATNLAQLSTPEESDQGLNSNSESPIPSTDHYWAIYLRDQEIEFYRFSPVADRKGNKRVQLRP